MKQEEEIFTLQILQTFFLHNTPNSSSSISSWGISIWSQFLHDQSLQGKTKVFSRRHTFLGVDIHRITQTPQWLIEHVYTYKNISLLTYPSLNHQKSLRALDALTERHVAARKVRWHTYKTRSTLNLGGLIFFLQGLVPHNILGGTISELLPTHHDMLSLTILVPRGVSLWSHFHRTHLTPRWSRPT